MRQTIQSRKYSYVCPVRYFIRNSEGNCEEYKEKLEKTLTKINKCCSQFIGTHNFHNYTRGLKYTDPESKRYII
jgi:tRNA pseudouridine38-40 synthase